MQLKLCSSPQPHPISARCHLKGFEKDECMKAVTMCNSRAAVAGGVTTCLVGFLCPRVSDPGADHAEEALLREPLRLGPQGGPREPARPRPRAVVRRPSVRTELNHSQSNHGSSIIYTFFTLGGLCQRFHGSSCLLDRAVISPLTLLPICL